MLPLMQVRNLKQQANTLTDEASQLRYRLSQCRGQQELLKSQIVQVRPAGGLAATDCLKKLQGSRVKRAAPFPGARTLVGAACALLIEAAFYGVHVGNVMCVLLGLLTTALRL